MESNHPIETHRRESPSVETSNFRLTFWGVRGSIPSPGPTTSLVGGNTSCIELRAGADLLILDAGTGLRALGQSLLRRRTPVDATILLSHLHWDHIQGIPFFAPAYVPSTRLTIVGARSGNMSLEEALTHQMTAPVFPVRKDELGAKIDTKHVRPGEVFDVGDCTVRVAHGHHPGGVLAYRIEYAGRSLVYATDTEHFSCVDPELLRIASGADVLIYDAQYTPEEYRGDGGRSKVGWGHSTYVAAAELAKAAGAGRLVLYHHDPERTDEQVFRIEDQARRLFAETCAAREGTDLWLSGGCSTEAAA